MSFLLSENREHDFHGYWKRYEEYLKAEGHRMPSGALKLALSAKWYDFSIHQCPHDAWLEECRIIESDSGGESSRCGSLEIRLLGAYHDGTIHLRYPRLYSYSMQSSKCEKGMNDWRYDEFRLSGNGHLLHEIEWASGDRWLIEADDIEFEWRPFEAEAGSP